jgi:Spy/CpxP family protein refolding chaperone
MQRGVGEEMFVRKGLLGIMGMILACGMVAFAQQPQPPAPTQAPDGTFHRDRTERKERHRGRMGERDGFGQRGPGIGHFIRDLNLSDAQQAQVRAITQRRLEGTRSQREELFKLREKRTAGTFTPEDEARAKALHQEIRASMEGIQTEVDSILTAEQKARLEELQKERKAKMELRMKERHERLNTNPQ